jgi:hypothetical protein
MFKHWSRCAIEEQETNMGGAVEEGAKLAGGFLDALKREPLSLALVVMNLSLLAFCYVILIRVADQRKEEVGLLYDDKKQVRELLAKCVVPPRADLHGLFPLPQLQSFETKQ